MCPGSRAGTSNSFRDDCNLQYVQAYILEGVVYVCSSGKDSNLEMDISLIPQLFNYISYRR